MLPKRILLTSVVLLLVGLTASTAQAVVIIDDFTTAQSLSLSAMDSSISSSASGAGIVGGTREVTLAISGSPMSPFDLIEIQITAGDASYETIQDNFDHSLTLTYDGNGMGLGAALDNATILRVCFATFQPVPADSLLLIEAVVTPTMMSPISRTMNIVGSATLFVVDFDFTGENFSSLSSVEFRFQEFTPGGTDYTLTGIKALTTSEIPEPASLGIWAVVLACSAGVHFRRRRRRINNPDTSASAGPAA